MTLHLSLQRVPEPRVGKNRVRNEFCAATTAGQA